MGGGPDKFGHQLYFSKEVIWLNDLKGKRLKFYADKEKKAIAWRVMDGEVSTLDSLNKAREVKPWSSGSWAVGITKLLNHIGAKIEEGRSGIPVERYTTTEMGVGMKYDYIKLT